MNPVTSLFSPQVEIYAGNRNIEGQVERRIASNGRQLGIVTEAVLELAAHVKGAGDGKAVQRLTELAEDVEAVKDAARGDLAAKALTTLKALKSADRDAFDRVVAEVNED